MNKIQNTRDLKILLDEGGFYMDGKNWYIDGKDWYECCVCSKKCSFPNVVLLHDYYYMLCPIDVSDCEQRFKINPLGYIDEAP